MDTIGTLCINLASVANPCAELQNIRLWSYRFSTTPKTALSMGSNRPSDLMDQLLALKPGSLDYIIQDLFFRKMARYIRDVVNPIMRNSMTS
jgi:hypothetical protein